MQALHDAHSALGEHRFFERQSQFLSKVAILTYAAGSSTYTWPSGNVYVKEPGT
jgi:hypothetical protein